MTEGAVSRLARQIRAEVLPAFFRASLLKLFPSETIGDEGKTKWFINLLKPLSEPINREAGGDWEAEEDKIDMTGYDIHLYDVQDRVTMNRSARARWEKNGVLSVGIDEIGTQLANKANKNLFIGKEVGDQFEKTNNQFITKQNASSTDPSDPGLGTAASAGKWDAFGQPQLDFAALAGNLEKRGYNVATSVVLYPEIVAEGMRRPLINATNHVSQDPVISLVEKQGFMGSVSVKDGLLLEESADAVPTVEKFDLYAVDVSKVRIGYTVDENIQEIYNPYEKKTLIDSQVIFTPAFLPIKYDTDGFYYKGVSRITAIDLNT